MMYQEQMSIIANAVKELTGYGVTVELMRGRSRKREVVVSRHIFMHLMRKRKENFSLASIGAHLGKDHATVLHGNKTVTNMIDTNDWLYTSALEATEQPFNESMDASIEAILMTGKSSQEQIDEMQEKMMEAIEKMQERAEEKVEQERAKVGKVVELLREAKVQGWVLHKVNLILQQ